MLEEAVNTRKVPESMCKEEERLKTTRGVLYFKYGKLPTWECLKRTSLKGGGRCACRAAVREVTRRWFLKQQSRRCIQRTEKDIFGETPPPPLI